MVKVLFVVTNTNSFPDGSRQTGWYVINPPLPQFDATRRYLPELAHPWEKLVSAGHTIDYVSPKGGVTVVDEGSVKNFTDKVCVEFLHNEKEYARLSATLRPDEVNPADYRAIFYVGGHGPMWDVAKDKAIGDIAAKIYEAGGFVSAVCRKLCAHIAASARAKIV
jgi:putative intracellular protease/amidase